MQPNVKNTPSGVGDYILKRKNKALIFFYYQCSLISFNFKMNIVIVIVFFLAK